MRTFSLAQVCALAAVASVQAEERLLGSNLGSQHECLYLDDEHVAVFKKRNDGVWVDDGAILLENWESGMGIQEMVYCTEGKDGVFLSLQLTVGNDEEQFALEKHGGDHPDQYCRRWRLEPEDYIKHVIYTWSDALMKIVQVVFQTKEGKSRVVGMEYGFKEWRTEFEYNEFQPLVGFFTYQWQDETWAIGPYEDDCHLSVEQSNLPHGFGDLFAAPTMDDVKGQNAEESMIYQDHHGESTHEIVEALDAVRIEQTELDVFVEDSEMEAMVVNVDDQFGFKHSEILEEEYVGLPIVAVEEPVAEPVIETKKTEVVEMPQTPPESLQVMTLDEDNVQKQVTQATSYLEKELQILRQDLMVKEKQLSQFVAEEEVTLVKAEESQGAYGSLLIVMMALLIMALLVVICLCCYVSSLKRQRNNAREVFKQTAGATASASDAEASDLEKRNVRRVGAPGGDREVWQNNYQEQQAQPEVFSPDPLESRRNTQGETSHTQMMGAPQTPIGTFQTNQTDKEQQADTVVRPEAVELDFGVSQPTQQNPQSEIGGRNPFADTDRSVDDGADLNLTEESVRGPDNKEINDQFNAMPANMNTRQ